MQAIARLTRFPVTDSIGQNDEKFRRVEWLAGTEQLAGKFRAKELPAAAGCSMHDQNRVGGFSLRILLRLSQGAIMNTQLR